MAKMLLAAAAGVAAIAVTGPAAAQEFRHSGNSPRQFVDGSACASMASRHRDDGRDHGFRSNNVSCQSNVVMDWYGGEWALYNNRSWAPDSYNDWWHDRPDRAYPRWMANNRDCQRRWYAGDVLRC